MDGTAGVSGAVFLSRRRVLSRQTAATAVFGTGKPRRADRLSPADGADVCAVVARLFPVRVSRLSAKRRFGGEGVFGLCVRCSLFRELRSVPGPLVPSRRGVRGAAAPAAARAALAGRRRAVRGTGVYRYLPLHTKPHMDERRAGAGASLPPARLPCHVPLRARVPRVRICSHRRFSLPPYAAAPGGSRRSKRAQMGRAA